MDEYEASAAPTAGREATSGRGAVTAPPRPAPASMPASDAPALVDPAESGEVPAVDGMRTGGPLLVVTVSRPSEVAQDAVSSVELPGAKALPAGQGPEQQEVQWREPSTLPRLASTMPPPEHRTGTDTSRPWGLPDWPRVTDVVRRGMVYGAIAFAAWFSAVMASIVLFRFVDPPYSNLMLAQRISGEVLVHSWLPIERIPAQVIRAIVVSEDGRFCEHGGIDLKAIEVAIETAKDGTPRGASTITMQVAKNLYLWPSKSYVRKALEVPITLAIEAMWSKRRIFEVYANIAEWGPGIFGVEAAAGYHFGKSASRVSEREAALLAVALPNPVTRDAGDPGPGTERLANTIQSRMRAQSRAASCIERPQRI